jgi:putative DNA methylase
MLERAPKPTKVEQVAAEVAKAIGAGRAVAVETVDFNNPHRPKTCLEVDFPILPVNRVAQIEGNAGKPIYQMSKWWARRRSSVFRSLLLASAMKAPDDPALAAKAVWDVYYANHQKKGALSQLKVADIFMGGAVRRSSRARALACRCMAQTLIRSRGS